MTQVQCLRVRIRPGQTERVVDFLRGLGERAGEVGEALAAEGIVLESLFLERDSGGDFLVFYARAADLVAANRAFVESQRPLDLETKAWIAETWGEIRALELLVDLEGGPAPDGGRGA